MAGLVGFAKPSDAWSRGWRKLTAKVVMGAGHRLTLYPIGLDRSAAGGRRAHRTAIIVGVEPEERHAALERFERAVELPLLILALLMVPLLVLPLVVDLPSGVQSSFLAADWFIWAAFAFEYVVRLALTDQRWRFVRREWPDLLIILLPLLRPLRVVRSARAVRLLRLTRLVTVLSEAGQQGRRLLVRHKLHYALLITLVAVVGAAALMLAVEDGAGGNIGTFGDALWWAITTVTTVGYGDTFPVTPAGKGIAALLMATGITLFGILTANIAAFFVEQDQEDEQEQTPTPWPSAWTRC